MSQRPQDSLQNEKRVEGENDGVRVRQVRFVPAERRPISLQVLHILAGDAALPEVLNVADNDSDQQVKLADGA